MFRQTQCTRLRGKQRKLYLLQCLWFVFAFPESNPKDVRGQTGTIVFADLVVAAQQFGQLLLKIATIMIVPKTTTAKIFYLMIMEDGVCIAIAARRCVGPQLFHEEHLVSEM